MNIFDIDDLLETMAIEGRRRFSPNYICERLHIDEVIHVADYLLSLTGQKVVPQFEVECPNGDSDFAVSDPRKIILEPRVCSICGEEYIPDPEKIWLIFDFTDNYIDYVKKKRTASMMKNQPRTLIIQAVM